MPLPGSRVIPAGWSDHHRPVAEGTMTAPCRIDRSVSDGTTAPDGSWIPGVLEQVYRGMCRLVRSGTGDEDNPIAGDRRLTTRRYEVQLPADTAVILVGDVLVITEGDDEFPAGDEDLTGRSFRIESVRVASEQWSRNLTVTEFEEGQ